MGQQDNFGSGFVLGTLFGGLVGGVVGAVVAARVSRSASMAVEDDLLPNDAQPNPTRLSPTDADIELARRGLEDKIAQLNIAIDDVRQRLGGENGHAQSIQEEHSTQ